MEVIALILYVITFRISNSTRFFDRVMYQFSP